MNGTQHPQERQYDKPIPDFPKYCRICGSPMDAMSEETIAYDIFTKEPRTTKYLYACRASLNHTKLVVVDTPARSFRAVIREDRFDEKRVRR